MGMAASQARFLQLTARRTNIEYMGQQINQQRLALANASAGLFEKMLTLETPVPPSTMDDKYYKQGYTFTDTRDELQKSITWNTVETSVDITDLDTGLGGVATAAPAGQIRITTAAGGGATVDISTAALAGVPGSTTTQADAIEDLYDAIHGAGTHAALETGYTQVVRMVSVKHDIYNPDGNYTTVEEKAPALLEFDNLNRLLNVTLLQSGKLNFDKTTQDETNTAFGIGDNNNMGNKLTYSSVFDSTTYQNDVNRYEFVKASYDYQVERINQETRIIQTQDKSLELKMKQLDTEHNAIQTEMDAVQKVLQKNIEGSFKTFA